MPRRALPLAMTDDAPTRAPKKKRPAARKIASNPARKRTKAKTKASRHVAMRPLLQLPAPGPIPLLTYVGPSQQIGFSAIAIDLPRQTEKSSAPHIIESGPEIDDAVGRDMPRGCSPAAMPDDTQVARAKPQPVDAVRQDLSAPSGTRPASLPETFSETPRRPVPPRVRRGYSIDPRVVTKVSFTAAVIGAVLLLARLPVVKPNDALNKPELPPTETIDRGSHHAPAMTMADVELIWGMTIRAYGTKQMLGVKNNTTSRIKSVWANCGFFRNDQLVEIGSAHFTNIAPNQMGYEKAYSIDGHVTKIDCYVVSVDKE
jgi:hypothetical protein